MYVKTSFFDVEHEVKKDLFFVSAGIDILKKNNIHHNFFRNLTSKSCCVERVHTDVKNAKPGRSARTNSDANI